MDRTPSDDNATRARAWFERLLHAEGACEGHLSINYATELAGRAIAAAVEAKACETADRLVECEAEWFNEAGEALVAQGLAMTILRAHASDVPEVPKKEQSGMTVRERSARFNDTTGALTWNYRSAIDHPDRCVCQNEMTPHKHYDEAPHRCARCNRCEGYTPAVQGPVPGHH